MRQTVRVSPRPVGQPAGTPHAFFPFASYSRRCLCYRFEDPSINETAPPRQTRRNFDVRKTRWRVSSTLVRVRRSFFDAARTARRKAKDERRKTKGRRRKAKGERRKANERIKAPRSRESRFFFPRIPEVVSVVETALN